MAEKSMQVRMQEAMNLAKGWELKFEATRALHDAHVFSRENEQSDLLRQQLHILLDHRLDAYNQVMQMLRVIMETPPDN